MNTRNFIIAAIVYLAAHSTTLCAKESATQTNKIAPEWNCHPSLIHVVPDRQNKNVYMWTDEDGIVQFSDSIPPEYDTLPKERLNTEGVAFEELEGKKTELQRAREERKRQLEIAKKLQERADQALVDTYMRQQYEDSAPGVRRAEPLLAQPEETELRIRNLQRRLEGLEADAAKLADIDESLLKEICETKEAIRLHQDNLRRFRKNLERIKDNPKRHREAEEESRMAHAESS